MKKLTTDDIQAAYADDRWLGWGYLGGRCDLPASDRVRADDIVIAHANDNGWDTERLFRWLNSRPGRHFADDPFHPKAFTCLTTPIDDDDVAVNPDVWDHLR